MVDGSWSIDEDDGAAPAERASGAIVYLCCADEAEVEDLRRSVRLLYVHFNRRRNYPVLIFHDMLTPRHMATLRAEALHARDADDATAAADADAADSRAASELAALDMRFVDLDPTVFSLPSHLPADVVAAIPRYVRGYGMGYRHMCRFFSGPLFRHAALRAYEFVWRLDSDSFLLGAPLQDPFEQMARHNASYAWLHAYRDEQAFVTGLWGAAHAHLLARGVDEQRVHDWVPEARKWFETPMCFATNFFVARVSWFASEAYTAFFDALDRHGGFYTYRWGDACVHMLAVAALLPREAVLRLSTVPYWHQGVRAFRTEATLPSLCLTPVHHSPFSSARPCVCAMLHGRRSCCPASITMPRWSC